MVKRCMMSMLRQWSHPKIVASSMLQQEFVECSTLMGVIQSKNCGQRQVMYIHIPYFLEISPQRDIFQGPVRCGNNSRAASIETKKYAALTISTEAHLYA